MSKWGRRCPNGEHKWSDYGSCYACGAEYPHEHEWFVDKSSEVELCARCSLVKESYDADRRKRLVQRVFGLLALLVVVGNALGLLRAGIYEAG